MFLGSPLTREAQTPLQIIGGSILTYNLLRYSRLLLFKGACLSSPPQSTDAHFLLHTEQFIGSL